VARHRRGIAGAIAFAHRPISCSIADQPLANPSYLTK
jgi:hypothetical protein